MFFLNILVLYDSLVIFVSTVNINWLMLQFTFITFADQQYNAHNITKQCQPWDSVINTNDKRQ